MQWQTKEKSIHSCEYFKITLGGDETSVPITKRHGVKSHKTADNQSKNKMMHPNLEVHNYENEDDVIACCVT